jgi:cellobiose phosphorylase
MVYHGIFGMRFSEDSLGFDPIIPKGITSAKLENLKYRNMTLDIELKGEGKTISGFKLDDKECQPYVVNSLKGRHTVGILMKGENNNGN